MELTTHHLTCHIFKLVCLNIFCVGHKTNIIYIPPKFTYCKYNITFNCFNNTSHNIKLLSLLQKPLSLNMRCCFANNKNPLKIFPNENNTNQYLRPGVFSFFKSFSIHITLLPLITQSSAIIEKQKFRQPLFYIDDIRLPVLGQRFGFGHATFLNASFGLYFCDLQCEWDVHYKYNWVIKQSKSKSTLDCPIMCQSDFDNFYSKVKKMGFYGMGQPVYFI